jgi:hypothetical protein
MGVILDLVNDFTDKREWVVILHHDVVELPIILDWSEASVLFLDKEERYRD